MGSGKTLIARVFSKKLFFGLITRHPFFTHGSVSVSNIRELCDVKYGHLTNLAVNLFMVRM